MRSLQPAGALLIIVGVIMLYLLRGPLISLILLVLEFLAILVALIIVVVGVALLAGGGWMRRRFWLDYQPSGTINSRQGAAELGRRPYPQSP